MCPPLPAWGSRPDEAAPRSRRQITLYYHQLSCLPESHTNDSSLILTVSWILRRAPPPFPLYPATALYFPSSFFGKLFPLPLLPSVISRGHTSVFNCPSSGLTRANDL